MRYRPDQFVAGHLRMSDLACKCENDCTHKDLDDQCHQRSLVFFRRVGRLIGDYGFRVSVSSGLRCPIHNASPKVGGSPNSAHVYRCAIDLHPDGPPGDLYLLAEEMGFFGGIIWYPWGVHLDLHPNDRVVRGYSYGSKENRLLRLGVREGSPLEAVYDWNCDCTIEKPHYIRWAEEHS